MPYPRIQVILRYIRPKTNTPPPILSNAIAAAQAARKICNANTILWREELIMMCLNRGDKLMNWYPVAIGGVDSVPVDLNIIGTVAAKAAAQKVILVHNHPGGNLEPSIADVRATYAVMAMLKTLNISLADHIILTDEGFSSMRDENLL